MGHHDEPIKLISRFCWQNITNNDRYKCAPSHTFGENIIARDRHHLSSKGANKKRQRESTFRHLTIQRGLIVRHHSKRQRCNQIRNLESQILFITAILIVFFCDATKLLITANCQQPDWPNSLGSWRYGFASSRHVYSPEIMKGVGERRHLSHQSASEVNKETTRRLNSSLRYDSASSAKPIHLTTKDIIDNRYRYELATQALAPLRPHGQVRLDRIQERLADLRLQLESELAVEEVRQQVTLGSPCLRASDCSNSIRGSHCKLDTFTCSCLPYHVENNSTTCLAPSLLGFECQIDAQCQKKVADSYCSQSSGTCVCKAHLVAYRKDKCLAASQLNDYCLTDRQCQLADKHSHCKWKIPHVYGLCKCPPNYKPITMAEEHWQAFAGQQQQQQKQLDVYQKGSFQQQQHPTQPLAATMKTLCAPRLGDSCFDQLDCLLATPNSTCRLPEPKDTLKPTWASSNVSARKCFCQTGFAPAPNRLDCLTTTTTTTTTTTNQSISSGPSTTSLAPSLALPVPTQLPASSSSPEPARQVSHTTIAQLASSSQMDDKHQYELLVSETPLGGKNNTANSAEQQQQQQQPLFVGFDQQQHDLNAGKAIEKYPNATTTPTISSLGKTCKTRSDCQARDKYSDCISGRCDCIKRTTKCSANLTGCHRDTFQCRNGQCISWYFVCDQFKNCNDGSDEDECRAGRCPPEAFRCDDGACLSRAKICNGRLDCKDGSDERQCNITSGSSATAASVTFTWPSASKLELASSSGRVAATLAGLSGQQQQQQRKKDDSLQLPAANVHLRGLCHPGAFQCDNGQCLPAYVFCNAVADCLDGSDEREWLCERQLPAPPIGSSPLPVSQLQVAANGSDLQSPTSNSLAISTTGRPDKGSPPAANPSSLLSSSSSSSSLSSTKDSPLVKADRTAIDKMLAALNLAGRTPESRSLLQQQQQTAQRTLSRSKRANSSKFPSSHSQASPEPGKRRRIPIHQRRESKLTRFERGRTQSSSAEEARQNLDFIGQQAKVDVNECPKSSFTCANGKCRSSAILCSGVDGCGDNSDEDRCEVCQCEAP